LERRNRQLGGGRALGWRRSVRYRRPRLAPGNFSIAFLDGDAVTFNNTAATTVNIQGFQKTVAQMMLSGNGNLIINGNILGDKDLSTLLTATGELTKSGNGDLTLNGKSHFVGGIYLNKGSTNIGYDSELFTDGSLLVAKSSGDNASLSLTEGGKVSADREIVIGMANNSNGTVLGCVVNRCSAKWSGSGFARRQGMRRHSWHIGWQCLANA
jgi:autotransporter-associated beta strand protein